MQIEHLTVLENLADITEFAKELELKILVRKKFIKAVYRLIMDTQQKEQATAHVVLTSNKPDVVVKRKAQDIVMPPLKKPKRMKFPPGVHVVPYEKREYRVSKIKQEYEQNGSIEYVKPIVDVFRTVNNKISRMKTLEKLFADDEHKIILVCGKTGVGKSTLINSMMNYIYGVGLDDDFRLKLIEEVKKGRW